MVDIPKLARESGASFDRIARQKSGADMWVFSQNELQLYTEKVILAAQAAEKERAKELVGALKYARRFLKKELHDVEFIDATIAKYEGEK